MIHPYKPNDPTPSPVNWFQWPFSIISPYPQRPFAPLPHAVRHDHPYSTTRPTADLITPPATVLFPGGLVLTPPAYKITTSASYVIGRHCLLFVMRAGRGRGSPAGSSANQSKCITSLVVGGKAGREDD